MGILFPTDAWVQALKDALNHSAAYAEAAKNFEADFVFVVEPEGPVEQPVTFYLDLWHGKCREARRIDGPGGFHPVAMISAKVSTWKRVIQNRLDPIQGLMTGQIRLRGNMVIIMRNVRPAKEMILAATTIPTDFPL